jgi:uncharacterized protein (TIGR03083 family)
MSLDHLAHLRREAAGLATAVAAGAPDAPIAGCPGWTLRGLAKHVGTVHRWARGAVLTADVPKVDPEGDPMPEGAEEMAQWLRDGAGRLIDTLSSTDVSAPTWHPFPVEPKVAGLWRRRQCQETFVHRLDAELAIGLDPVIDRELAADGVDEYWTVMLPRMLSREGRATPSSVLAVRLTDAPGEWVVDGRSGVVVLGAAVSAAPAATISGTAAAMLLRLWGRPVADGAVEVAGDSAAAAQWLALGGA